MSFSYYSILEIEKSASTEEIRKSYRRLSLLHHPDKGGEIDKFRDLSNAYQVLSNDELRAKYDSEQVISPDILIPPLKVFNDHFTQWLSQYPLIEYIFKDNCRDIIEILNTNAENPIIRVLINSLTGNSSSQTSTDDILRATNSLTTELFRKATKSTKLTEKITIEKKVYITLDDIYIGKRYHHQFVITNEDLHLSNDYKIINPEVQINLPLNHPAVDIGTELHIINQKYGNSYNQQVCVQLDIITMPEPNFYTIGEYDLLVYVDLTLEQFLGQKILSIPYLNKKTLSFNSPNNPNLRQLYKIENIALPNKTEKRRGDLFILFNLIISETLKSQLLPELPQSESIYNLTPCDIRLVLNTPI
jgi:curved DNA-binding protein CbpA